MTACSVGYTPWLQQVTTCVMLTLGKVTYRRRADVSGMGKKLLISRSIIKIEVRSKGVGFRHCATSRRAMDSFHDEVFQIFHLLNLSGRTAVLRSNQHLTKISPRYLPWVVKTAGA